MKYAIVTVDGLRKQFPTVMDLLYEIEQGEAGWRRGLGFTVEQSGVAIFDNKDYERCADVLYKDYKAERAAGKTRAKMKPMSIKRILHHKEAMQSEVA